MPLRSSKLNIPPKGVSSGPELVTPRSSSRPAHAASSSPGGDAERQMIETDGVRIEAPSGAVVLHQPQRLVGSGELQDNHAPIIEILAEHLLETEDASVPLDAVVKVAHRQRHMMKSRHRSQDLSMPRGPSARSSERTLDWDLYPPDPHFVVLGDPDGNPFCVVDLSRS